MFWSAGAFNPVLPGFQSDPSIVRVGEDYAALGPSSTRYRLTLKVEITAIDAQSSAIGSRRARLD